MEIRDETPSDWSAVDRLVRQAFDGSYESGLIERLRRADLVVLALVADAEGQIVGHVVLSRLTAEVDGRPVSTVALAPMAVRTDRQRRGVGSRLITTAIERVKTIGIERSSCSDILPTTRASGSLRTSRPSSRRRFPDRPSWR